MTDTSSLHTDQPLEDQTIDSALVSPPAAPDPRHQKRASLMQVLFSYSFEFTSPGFADQFEVHPELREIVELLPEIDAEIKAEAPERPLSEINKVDLAILRVVVFESKRKKTPKKVLINEAVELAKEFGTESSPRFVNGVSAKILMG